jgi:peptidyl-prolyl cis-trans isomerase SurA
MKKINILFLTMLLLTAHHSNGQVLFTYGKHPVTVAAFKQSFEKNNPDSTNSKTAFQNYLNLYINFKLKVKAAYDLKMDTLPNQIADRMAFEEQIKPIHMLDSATLYDLINEAVEHSKEAIEVSHIFISFKHPFTELDNESAVVSSEEKELAYRKLKELKQRLAIGEAFENVAIELSNDSEVKQNKGHLGFIKAFTLPYRFEKIAYALKDGEVSEAIESNLGLHVFKKTRSKKVEGNLTISQILITIPENANANEVTERGLFADRIYQQAMSDVNFDSLVNMYSEDRSSNTMGGIVADAETGDYDPVFEERMNALKQDGEISPVFKTAYGFHIIKRIKKDSLNTNSDQWKSDIKEMTLQDARTEIAKEAFIQKSIGKNGLTKDEKNKELFIADRLQDFSTGFKSQINEFKDGNLLFDIMDKKIWSKASNDLVALKSFHAARKQNYQWKNSVTAFTITTQSQAYASVIKEALQQNKSIENLRKQYSEIAFIDSTRQEAGSLLGVGIANAKQGFISEIYTNESDGTVSFVYIQKVHPDPTTMSFEEARISVINDYQTKLEEAWIMELKKKYPITINQAELKKALSALD